MIYTKALKKALREFRAGNKDAFVGVDLRGADLPHFQVCGELVYPDSYDDDIRVECTHGIHFFMTRREAEEY